jgi:hypothetical protein
VASLRDGFHDVNVRYDKGKSIRTIAAINKLENKLRDTFRSVFRLQLFMYFTNLLKTGQLHSSWQFLKTEHVHFRLVGPRKARCHKFEIPGSDLRFKPGLDSLGIKRPALISLIK